MINEIEMYKEPLEIMSRLTKDYGSEMSEWEACFLCSLVKKYMPKKIVEVGVAAGGTTAILFNCISMLRLDTEIYSVDLNEKFYRDKSKETGYLSNECQSLLQQNINHKMYLGGILPEFIEDIGEEIDFLILDTVHCMPGEILDFLVSLPKLKDGAIVVLHDIILNHIENLVAEAYVTKVLLSTVVGKKIICKGGTNPYNYPNIAAFEITQDTRKYIENVFLALTVTWSYMPDNKHLDLYRQCFSRYYSEGLCEEFDKAMKLNRDSIKKRRNNLNEELHVVKKFIENVRGKKNIWIYGCGKLGKRTCSMLEYFGIKIEGYVISDDQMKPYLEKEVKYISDIDNGKCTFILGMSVANQNEICIDDIKSECICINKYIIKALPYFI